VYSIVWPGFVGVDDVDHDAKVFGELGVVGDDELVGDVDRAAERGLVVVQRHAGRGHRRRGRFFLAASGQTCGDEHKRGKAERDNRTRTTLDHRNGSLQLRSKQR
jgi:hypothetical protein